jgi:hypothetical protein
MESNGTFDVDAIGLVTIPERSTQSTQTKLETSDPESAKDEPGPPSTAVGVLQRWNSPRINMWRVFACFWSLFVMGMNDGSYGVSCANFDLNWALLTCLIGFGSIRMNILLVIFTFRLTSCSLRNFTTSTTQSCLSSSCPHPLATL